MLTTSGIYNYEKCRRVSVPNPYLILPMAEFTVDLRAMVIGRARTHRRFRCCVVWLAVFLSCRGVCADELRAVKLLTGRGFMQALESPRSLSVRDAPLHRILQSLQAQAGVCIVVDRRIDPSQRLTLSTDLIPTEDLLRMIAAQLPSAGVSVNRSFVYIGPGSVAWSLRTLCEQNRSDILESRRKFAAETYGRLTAAEPFAWVDLESPRDLVVRLAARVGLAVVNPELVPHDLWHAGGLSKMPFAESATVLLCQFNLTFAIAPDTTHCRIVPLPDVVLLERRHRVTRGLREVAELQLAQEFPDLDVMWERSGVRFSATYEQHQQIAELISGRRGLQDK
jgi:hypothetical protein